MQKSHVAYNQRKYAPAVCARRSPACMRGIVSHRSTACMHDGLVCTTGLYALSPLDFSASIRDGLVCDLGFYPRLYGSCSRGVLIRIAHTNTVYYVLMSRFWSVSVMLPDCVRLVMFACAIYILLVEVVTVKFSLFYSNHDTLCVGVRAFMFLIVWYL